MSKHFRYLIIIGWIALSCAVGQLPAAQVSLQWSPATSNADGTALNDLTGYRVYWGAASRAYTSWTNIGSVTQTTVSGLAGGSTSYFAITARNTAGRESAFSPEVSCVSSVPVPPTITAQPLSVTVTAGATAQFTIQASGVPTPGAQWLKNSVAVAGATNFAYVLPPTVLADNGARFACVAINSAGSATSQVAVLTVQSANLYPPQWAPVTNQTVLLGSLVSFVVTATDPDGPSPTLATPVKPAAATFVDNGNGHGTFAWTPTLTSDVGDHSVQFTAYDGLHTSTTAMVFHVSASASTNNPPAGSVTLQWNAATSNLDGTVLSDLAGYRIYWGAASRAYTMLADVGKVTQSIVTGLTAQTACYLAVVSFNARGVESPFSVEVVYTAPASGQAAVAAQSLALVAATPSGATAQAAVTAGATTNIATAGKHVSMDFDGNGRSDPAVFSHTDGTILFQTAASGEPFATSMGDTNWIPCAADFDGDGRTDPAWFVPSNGEWVILLSSQGYAEVSPRPVFGGPDDLPIPVDFDGEGQADLAVFSRSNGTISYRGIQATNTFVTPIGDPSWIPCPADFDGDGRADPAWFVPATGVWHILESSHGYAERSPAPVLGDSSSLPVPADFDGDGKADLAVFSRTTGQISVQESGTGRQWTSVAGASGFVPAVGDYDGDGRADCAWRRPATQDLLVVLTGGNSSSNELVLGPLGGANDWPLAAPVSGW